jgi:eukaryotic-like serine/threonine-protein kinase
MVTSVPSSAAPTRAPEKIGKYVIINEVGKGTTGSVYLSHDPYSRRDVAIKVYAASPDDDPQRARIARKMFFNEAHMVGKLQHPNILPIIDAGEEEGKYYVVMEHVQRARTLEAYCRPDNLLHVEDVVKIIYKCAKALHYAHKRGVIHRDIKPTNIMLTNDNDVRIIDFGIAILKDADFSRIEGIAGSPSYMSPEQVQGADIAPASDLYSLGAVMYELLTGLRPFRSSTLAKLLNQIVYSTPPPVHTLRFGVPEELEEVVARALQKDPAHRYANGSEFAGELTRVYNTLKDNWKGIESREHFDQLRRLSFFHAFSQTEIHDLLRASEWREYSEGDEIVREGELDERYYVVVSGKVTVQSGRRAQGLLGEGDCFGDAGQLSGTRSAVSVRAASPVTVLSVSGTLLEQVSTECQLRFTKVFLQAMIRRLRGRVDDVPAVDKAT